MLPFTSSSTKETTRRTLKYVLIGAAIGLIASILILMTQHLLIVQDIRILLALVGPPLVLNRITINLSSLVNFVTFIYFIFLFSFLGYLLGLRMKRTHFMMILGLIFAMHIVFAYLGGKALFSDFFRGLRELPGISLK